MQRLPSANPQSIIITWLDAEKEIKFQPLKKSSFSLICVAVTFCTRSRLPFGSRPALMSPGPVVSLTEGADGRSGSTFISEHVLTWTRSCQGASLKIDPPSTFPIIAPGASFMLVFVTIKMTGGGEKRVRTGVCGAIVCEMPPPPPLVGPSDR